MLQFIVFILTLQFQATRHARRVYVGGLPPTANEQVKHLDNSQFQVEYRNCYFLSGSRC